jgi:hypothetical protein
MGAGFIPAGRAPIPNGGHKARPTNSRRNLLFGGVQRLRLTCAAFTSESWRRDAPVAYTPQKRDESVASPPNLRVISPEGLKVIELLAFIRTRDIGG